MTNDELRRLAEAATPGPWCNMADTVFHGEIRQASDDGFALIATMPYLDDREADFEYIAAMHPARAIELLDEVDRLQGLVAVLASEYSETVVEPYEAVEWAKSWIANYERLRGLLKRCEWENGGWCPVCRERMNHGHASDCELARALRGER